MPRVLRTLCCLMLIPFLNGCSDTKEESPIDTTPPSEVEEATIPATTESESVPEPEEIEEDSWIDGLLTSGFHAVNDDELFGEEITGYSLY